MNNKTGERFYGFFDTPIGKLQIVANEKIILAIEFVEQTETVSANKITDSAKQQLQEYFAGKRQKFDLPLFSNGVAQGTDFQQSVWQALNTVTYAETCSYKDIANKINKPKAMRAVGTANGKNPLSIVVPCHRVIANDGSLAGYGSGVERKAWLLKHEKNNG